MYAKYKNFSFWFWGTWYIVFMIAGFLAFMGESLFKNSDLTGISQMVFFIQLFCMVVRAGAFNRFRYH